MNIIGKKENGNTVSHKNLNKLINDITKSSCDTMHKCGDGFYKSAQMPITDSMKLVGPTELKPSQTFTLILTINENYVRLSDLVSRKAADRFILMTNYLGESVEGASISEFNCQWFADRNQISYTFNNVRGDIKRFLTFYVYDAWTHQVSNAHIIDFYSQNVDNVKPKLYLTGNRYTKIDTAVQGIKPKAIYFVVDDHMNGIVSNLPTLDFTYINLLDDEIYDIKSTKLEPITNNKCFYTTSEGDNLPYNVFGTILKPYRQLLNATVHYGTSEYQYIFTDQGFNKGYGEYTNKTYSGKITNITKLDVNKLIDKTNIYQFLDEYNSFALRERRAMNNPYYLPLSDVPSLTISSDQVNNTQMVSFRFISAIDKEKCSLTVFDWGGGSISKNILNITKDSVSNNQTFTIKNGLYKNTIQPLSLIVDTYTPNEHTNHSSLCKRTITHQPPHGFDVSTDVNPEVIFNIGEYDTEHKGYLVTAFIFSKSNYVDTTSCFTVNGFDVDNNLDIIPTDGHTHNTTNFSSFDEKIVNAFFFASSYVLSSNMIWIPEDKAKTIQLGYRIKHGDESYEHNFRVNIKDFI